MFYKNGSLDKQFYICDLLDMNALNPTLLGYNINAIGLKEFDTPQICGFKTYTLDLTVLATDNITGIEIGMESRYFANGMPNVYHKLKTITNLDFVPVPYPTAPAFYKKFCISIGGNALDYTGYSFGTINPYISNINGDNFTIRGFLLICKG
jgi:hypothetical protein